MSRDPTSSKEITIRANKQLDELKQEPAAGRRPGSDRWSKTREEFDPSDVVRDLVPARCNSMACAGAVDRGR